MLVDRLGSGPFFLNCLVAQLGSGVGPMCYVPVFNFLLFSHFYMFEHPQIHIILPASCAHVTLQEQEPCVD